MIDAVLIDFGWVAAGKKSTAGSEDSRNGKLGVFLACLRSKIER